LSPAARRRLSLVTIVGAHSIPRAMPLRDPHLPWLIHYKGRPSPLLLLLATGDGRGGGEHRAIPPDQRPHAPDGHTHGVGAR